MSEQDQFITVYRAAHVVEANFLTALLADGGIEARALWENQPFVGVPFGPTDLLVRQADEAAARIILADYERRQKERAQRGP